MPEAIPLENISFFAQRLAERIAAVCPHVPPKELEDVSTRLAFSELAHSSDVAFEEADPKVAVVAPGNQVVWLPGASTSAIVLPAGEPQSRAVTAAQLRAWTRQHVASLTGIAARGSAVLRQARSALANSYEARTRTQ